MINNIAKGKLINPNVQIMYTYSKITCTDHVKYHEQV